MTLSHFINRTQVLLGLTLNCIKIKFTYAILNNDLLCLCFISSWYTSITKWKNKIFHFDVWYLKYPFFFSFTSEYLVLRLLSIQNQSIQCMLFSSCVVFSLVESCFTIHTEMTFFQICNCWFLELMHNLQSFSMCSVDTHVFTWFWAHPGQEGMWI